VAQNEIEPVKDRRSEHAEHDEAYKVRISIFAVRSILRTIPNAKTPHYYSFISPGSRSTGYCDILPTTLNSPAWEHLRLDIGLFSLDIFL